MNELIRIGDLVSRISYGGDLVFKVVGVCRSEQGEAVAHLKGVFMRLYADAPLTDIRKCSDEELNRHHASSMELEREVMKRVMLRRDMDQARYEAKAPEVAKKYRFFDVPGKVLHLDGDQEYLNLCLKTYQQLNIRAVGLHVAETQQPKVIIDLLTQHRPDILVMTGHDALTASSQDYNDVNNYRNSKYFVEAVRAARLFEPGLDDLVVFAGACQSYFEAIIDAGANFASSPSRILIHCYDPVFIAEKVAFTPICETVSIKEAITASVTGIEGVGGVETRGCFRLGLPRSVYAQRSTHCKLY